MGEVATNYLDRIADRLSALCDPDDPVLSPKYRALFRVYAVLVLTTGVRTTAEDVHNGWVIWALDHERPDHWSIVPWGELAEPVRALDEPYAAAIRAVASEVGDLGRLPW